MSRRILSMILAGLILNAVFYSTAKANNEAEFAAKVKTEIASLGAGNQTRVSVKLRDETRVKGCVSEIGDESFSVVNEKTRAISKIPYTAVKQIKGKNNLSGKTIGYMIWIGIIVAGGLIVSARGF
ncbi:MAG: hypothetical protein WA584_13930 [Pyrinomonadaceae bacterium]